MWENILASCIVIAVLFSIILALYLFNSARSMKQGRERMRQLTEKVKPGAKVMFSGGLVGTVLSIDGEYVKVEVAPKISMTVSFYGINEVL